MPTHVLTSAPPSAPQTFGACLQAELAARCERNSRYSLRAFANFLAVDHATLSQLLRGKRNMTAPTIRRLGERIGLTQDQIAHYLARGPDLVRRVQQACDETELLSVVGHWHMALRESKYGKDVAGPLLEQIRTGLRGTTPMPARQAGRNMRNNCAGSIEK
jgi:plasmid maintenance system antidote protein VapI